MWSKCLSNDRWTNVWREAGLGRWLVRKGAHTLGVCWPARTAEPMSCRVNGRPVSKNKVQRADEKAQQVRMPVTKPDHLSPGPRTPKEEGED